MTSTYYGRQDDSTLFVSAVRQARPPSTPYLTEKILTLASSCDRNQQDCESRQHGSVPSPVSPTDSVAQAMKNDLENAIGYIDNLAYEQKGVSDVPSTNKQLFPSDNYPASTAGKTQNIGRNAVFADRTNTLISSSKLATKANRPMDFHESAMNLTSSREAMRDMETKLLEPVGVLRYQEPAGSPPPQEASLYFHDESLSLNLSQSLEVDDTNTGGQNHIDASERPTRLLSTLQKGGLISSPERSRTITFLSVSKDPTPSKATILASSAKSKESCIATPTGQNKIDSRKATPFPRKNDHYVDRFEQENTNRKGNEWWRVRSSPQHDPSVKDMSVHFDSKESSATNEVNDGKSLKWAESTVTPLREHNHSSKGTPHPSSRIDHSRNTESGDAIIETPVHRQEQNSNLILTSPESAKKLLKSAMEALRDARKERDEARQWASEVKESVNTWVEDQRRLVRTESASLSINSNPIPATFSMNQQKAIEKSIDELRSEVFTSKSDAENHVRIMMKQDQQIQELTRQVAIMKEQISQIMKCDASKVIASNATRDSNPNKANNIFANGSVPKTPKNGTAGLARSASRSETSNASSRASQRTRRSTPSGGHLIDYGNGVTKEVHPDGTTVTRFQNGDVETRFCPEKSTSSPSSTSSMVAYYHCKEEVLQITQRDGSVLYEYANGQVERHCADGVKIILFPDGTKTVV